jgi:hypothetical protein
VEEQHDASKSKVGYTIATKNRPTKFEAIYIIATKNRQTKLLTTSHTFHRTPHVHDQETTTKASETQGKLKPWIRRLKNKTDFRVEPESQHEQRPAAKSELNQNGLEK